MERVRDCVGEVEVEVEIHDSGSDGVLRSFQGEDGQDAIGDVAKA
jgi:hypothetical protein